MVTYVERFLPIKSHAHIFTCSTTSSKIYWSKIKTFVNLKKGPIISPLFVNGKLITNVAEKSNP